MFEKRISIDRVECVGGYIQVRLAKQLIEDGNILSTEYHRTSFHPGQDVDAQIAAVNAHLALMNLPGVPQAAVDKIKAHASIEWTPEVVAAYEAKRKNEV